MNQAFNAFFKFDKGAVIGDIDNLAGYLRLQRILFQNQFPGVGSELLVAQGNALGFTVEAQDFTSASSPMLK